MHFGGTYRFQDSFAGLPVLHLLQGRWFRFLSVVTQLWHIPGPEMVAKCSCLLFELPECTFRELYSCMIISGCMAQSVLTRMFLTPPYSTNTKLPVFPEVIHIWKIRTKGQMMAGWSTGYCCWDCRYHRDCGQYCSNSREYQTY